MSVDLHELLVQLAILRTLMDVNPVYGMGLSEEDCRKYVGCVDNAIERLQEKDPTVTLYCSKIPNEISAKDIANHPKRITEV